MSFMVHALFIICGILAFVLALISLFKSKNSFYQLIMAIIIGVGTPLLVVTQWQHIKYLMPLFVGTFFFLTVNKFHIGDGKGATLSATLIAWALPLTGIPFIFEGIYSWLIGEQKFGPIPLALALYSLPAITVLYMLLQDKKVLPK